MEYNQKALGLRISKYRELNNLSQRQLSVKTGISQSYIASIEIGIGKTINIAKLIKIADALNVTVDDLLCDSISKLSNQNTNKNNNTKTQILELISTFSDKELIHFNRILQQIIKYSKHNTKSK